MSKENKGIGFCHCFFADGNGRADGQVYDTMYLVLLGRSGKYSSIEYRQTRSVMIGARGISISKGI